MNKNQFISHIARMEKAPTAKQWKELNSIARDLTVRTVQTLIDHKPSHLMGSNDRLGEQVHTFL